MRDSTRQPRERAGASSTIVRSHQDYTARPDAPTRANAPTPPPAGISRDPARRRRLLKEHARNAAPSSAQPAPSAPAADAPTAPQRGLLHTLAAWARRYLALWRYASTDERGEAIVILPPRDRRGRDSD